MANILLAYNNRAAAATLSGGSWDITINNLKTERRAQVTSSTNASSYNTQFVADLGANYTLRALGLTNHNLTANGQWRVVLSDAVLDVDYTGSMLRLPGSITYSGGANGTAGSIYGTLDATSAPRVDYSATNLASGTATQTISNVPAGTYVMVTNGSNAAVMATGPTVDNSGTIGTSTLPSFVVVTATGDVTLTVLSAATAIHFRDSRGLLIEEARENECLDNRDFSTANWTPLIGGTGIAPVVTPAYAISPSGATDATRIQLDIGAGTTGGDYALVRQVISGLEDATRTVYVKSNTGVNQSFTLVGANVDQIVTATPTWTRVAGPQIPGAGAGQVDISIVGDIATVKSLDVLFWSADAQVGAFLTSTIPTTSAAVTRTADTATITSTSFTAAHSATAGTLYAEFDVCTTVAGTRPVLSLDNDTANERIELYASGTDLKFKVVDGGSTVVDMTIGTIAANTAYKVAVAWAANDFAASLGGAAVVTDSSGTLPTLDRMRIGADQAGNRLNGHIRRFARWLTRRTNTELQTLATSGPDALGHDTGWMAAQALTFHGTEPDNWGEQYPLIAAFPATSARYAQVLIDDATNPDEEILLGNLFIGEGFQPEHNAEYGGFADGREDLSVTQYSAGGQLYADQRAQRRKVDFNFPVLTQAEADHLDEMRAAVGTVGSVLYVPDPADAAKTQRYGFVGRFRELSPIEYPFYNTRATPFRLEEKL